MCVLILTFFLILVLETIINDSASTILGNYYLII